VEVGIVLNPLWLLEVLANPLIIDVKCCSCVHCLDIERLCDPNSISILIVCGRVLQFTFDLMFVDGHGQYCCFAVELSFSRMLFLADLYADLYLYGFCRSWSAPYRSPERHFRRLNRFIAIDFSLSSEIIPMIL
jgi:hypothetical protein